MRYLVVLFLFLTSCGDDLYRSCEAPGDCEAPEGADAVCLDDDGEHGFCTWACAVDADCDEADDEDFSFVCAPFESTEGTHCFPSCEGAEDEDEACPPGMSCRSTGGGAENRKVCFPGAAS